MEGGGDSDLDGPNTVKRYENRKLMAPKLSCPDSGSLIQSCFEETAL